MRLHVDDISHTPPLPPCRRRRRGAWLFLGSASALYFKSHEGNNRPRDDPRRRLGGLACQRERPICAIRDTHALLGIGPIGGYERHDSAPNDSPIALLRRPIPHCPNTPVDGPRCAGSCCCCCSGRDCCCMEYCPERPICDVI